MENNSIGHFENSRWRPATWGEFCVVPVLKSISPTKSTLCQIWCFHLNLHDSTPKLSCYNFLTKAVGKWHAETRQLYASNGNLNQQLVNKLVPIKKSLMLSAI
jgi:hypothetical protein